MIITQNNLLKNPKRIWFLIKKKYKEKGILKTISSIMNVSFLRFKNRISHIIYYKNKRKSFVFNNEKYDYFYHPYNATWRNERVIEIPIIYSIIKQNKEKKILEMGNVLSHYFPTHHDILDKYEEAKNVINEDAADFFPKKKYDLIVSISTFEHVGWDEIPKKPEKIFKTLKNLKKCLNKRGKIIFTIPIGLNPFLDNLFKDKKIKIEKIYYFKKISEKNEWKQISFEESQSIKLNSPFRGVNGIIIGTIKN